MSPTTSTEQMSWQLAGVLVGVGMALLSFKSTHPPRIPPRGPVPGGYVGCVCVHLYTLQVQTTVGRRVTYITCMALCIISVFTQEREAGWRSEGSMRKGKGGDGYANSHVWCKQQKLTLVSAEKEKNKVCVVLRFASVQRPKTKQSTRSLFISVSSFRHPPCQHCLKVGSHRNGHVVSVSTAREASPVVWEEEPQQLGVSGCARCMQAPLFVQLVGIG